MAVIPIIKSIPREEFLPEPKADPTPRALAAWARAEAGVGLTTGTPRAPTVVEVDETNGGTVRVYEDTGTDGTTTVVIADENFTVLGEYAPGTQINLYINAGTSQVQVDRDADASIDIELGEDAVFTDVRGGTADISVTDNHDGGDIVVTTEGNLTAVVEDGTRVQVNGGDRVDINSGDHADVNISGANRADVSTGDGAGEVTINDVTGHVLVETGDGDNSVNIDAAGSVKVTTGDGNDTINATGIGRWVRVDSGDATDYTVDHTSRDWPAIWETTTETEEIEGNDTVNVDAGGVVTITTGDGWDTISAQSHSSAVNIDSNSGRDTITAAADGLATINSGSSNDTITVTDASVAEIRGGQHNDTIDSTGAALSEIFGDDGNDTIRTGDGDDVISGGAGDDTLFGGDGADDIRGGGNRDYIDGGTGNDTRLDGGTGDDTVYGGQGIDHIQGGAGIDYLDGGSGDDNIAGGGADDVVTGGLGSDTLHGGAGSDVIITGRGSDTVTDDSAATDSDTVFAQAGDSVTIDADDIREDVVIDSTLGNSVTITGSPEFVARVESDLNTLRATPEGQAILRSLDESGHNTTIVEHDKPTNAATVADGKRDDAWRIDSVVGAGEDAVVKYTPADNETGDGSEASERRPPIVGLVHELLHAQDYVNGTLQPGISEHADINGNPVYELDDDGNVELDADGNPVPDTKNNRELSVVGLEFDEQNASDDEEDASPISEHDPNTRTNTENSYRDELGLALRAEY